MLGDIVRENPFNGKACDKWTSGIRRWKNETHTFQRRAACFHCSQQGCGNPSDNPTSPRESRAKNPVNDGPCSCWDGMFARHRGQRR
jgi:hypothetical protein